MTILFKECPTCGGSGFSGRGTGYDDVCPECGGLQNLPVMRIDMTNPKYMRPGLPFALGKAIEELGELTAALGKTLRWGWSSVNPELPSSQQEPNASWVRREIKDVRDALDNLEREMEENL